MGGLRVDSRDRPRGLRLATLCAATLLGMMETLQAASCPAERPEPLLPTDPALCSSLAEAVRQPSALPLDQYEAKLDQFFGQYCHRDTAAGWRRDRTVRDTGPFTARFADGNWTGTDHGTHAPVVIWYSPEMADWLVANRADDEVPGEAPPVSDGAMMVKEMFPAPAADCVAVPPERLFPTSGAAIMIRDAEASYDGWFWGWYGFGSDSGWAPDWPPAPSNPLPNMGFAQYCLNCHASAENNHTFASPKNIQGEPGRSLVFLSQNVPPQPPAESHHDAVTTQEDPVRRHVQPLAAPDRDVLAALRAYASGADEAAGVPMPSQTYDQTWVAAGGPTAADTFLTSSQCLGCHDAGSTGLQFDMTAPNPHGDNLENLSPYATWRSSPMGLAGRDPFFFAQLASETQTFHPGASDVVQDTCLGCHGINGQRQFHVDGSADGGACAPFTREMVDAVPYPDGNPTAEHAKFGALARDGISCTACHRMALGEAGTAAADQPQNACVAERQEFLNPDNTGFARTFTGSFLVGAPDRLIGPFENPKTTPMKAAFGNIPAHDTAIASSEICGTCHTVHLPVMQDAEVIGHTYEQTTYPEWAFSAYRTGESPDGPLPLGAGSAAESCQGCHMPSRDAAGVPYRSKIASIQEYSNFPQAENVLPPEEIDLVERDGFARHTLVGLNVFLIKIAQQFPDILGIGLPDPMLGKKGLDPLLRTERAMLDLAAESTAAITATEIVNDGKTLSATVNVENKAGHKFPSGVGFRRAFVDFRVLDASGETLWASGRTDGAGVLVDAGGVPVTGENWWAEDCSARVEPEKRLHQPHYQTITRQDQVQIYQELVSTPPDGPEPPICGPGTTPQGMLTTSFLSICSSVKDNRLLPHGYLGVEDRKVIAAALGAGEELALETGSYGVGDDPDYQTGGGDSFVYAVPLADLPAGQQPASVEATLYYQATPPFYLQDRFCTAKGADTDRLKYLVGRLDLSGTEAEDWKLRVVTTGPVAIHGQ